MVGRHGEVFLVHQVTRKAFKRQSLHLAILHIRFMSLNIIIIITTPPSVFSIILNLGVLIESRGWGRGQHLLLEYKFI